MKILMLTTGMDIGGAETHIAELCRGLARAGHTPEVASAGGRYADELASEGIVQYKLPLDRKDPVSVAKCLRGLTGIIRDGNYDIVHAHARIPAFLCGSLQKKLGFRFTTTAHLDFKVNALWRAVSRWGESTMAVSEDLREYLHREYGVPEEQVRITVNGIDMDRFSPSEALRDEVRREFSIPAGDKLIVYISRLDEDRSAPAKLLCRAMPEICASHPNTSLLIVGDGDDFENVRAKAVAANSNIGRDAVKLAGARYDVYRFTAAADIFCAVSRSALEAMASECPVILSGNQGHIGIFTEASLPQAVATNFCCRGCPPPSEEQILRDVLSLLDSDTETLAAMGRYNRSVVSERYSLERMTSDYIEMYENLLPQRVFPWAEAVISGYFGYGNSGDESALDCLAAAIRTEYPEAKLAVLSRDPVNFGKAHNLKGIYRYSLPAVIRELRGARLLISGGGSLLQNATSSRSLIYYAGIIGLAKLCKTKVFIYANGIGPLFGRAGRRIAAGAAMKADRISVRDIASRQALADMGVPEERIHVTADPAFRMALEAPLDVSGLLERIGMKGGERYFAVSIRSAACTEEKRREICRACRDIYLNLGLTPVFVSMQESEDRELCRRIAEDTCGEALMAPAVSPAELRSLICEMELVLSMRLHLIIYAADSGVPAVGVSIDPKLDAVQSVLESAQLVYEDAFTAESFFEAARNALASDRDDIRKAALKLAGLAAEDARAAVELMKS